MSRCITWLVLVQGLVSMTFLEASKQKVSTPNQLVNLRNTVPGIKVDVIYATERNFTGKIIYQAPKCFLLSHVAAQLQKVQTELRQKGLGLLVWDAYRPVPAQWRLWNVCPNPIYVSDPRKGGRHTRGTTVDLTIVRLADGVPLEMGTEFDDFSEKAHFDSNLVCEQAQKNRKLLREIMSKHGFTGIKSEWWHFDYKDWQSYPPLEVEFDELT